MHYRNGLECILYNFAKGFSVGVGTRLLLTVFKIARGKQAFIRALRNAVTSKTTSQWGLFVGLLLCIANSTKFFLRMLAANSQISHSEGRVWDVALPLIVQYRGLVAGSLSGLSLLALPKSARSAVAVFVAVRTLEVQVRVGVSTGYLPHVPHADTLLMMLSSAQAMWAWIFQKQSISPSYRTFLLTQSQLDAARIDAIRLIQLGLPLNLEALNVARKKMGIALLTDPLAYKQQGGWRDIMYHNQPWTHIVPAFWKRGIVRGGSLYLPIYLVSALVFSHRVLSRRPLSALSKTMFNAVKSSVFLAVYCLLGMVPLALWRHLGCRHDVMGNYAQILPAIAGFVSGTATLIEKESRRIELALFVCRQAVASLWNLAGLENVPEGASIWKRHVDVMLFCFSCGHLLHATTQHAHVIRPSYMSALSYFFDNDRPNSCSSATELVPNVIPN